MKKALILTIVMLCTASVAFAQLGSVGTYADPAGADCNVVDDSQGLLGIWIVHTMTTSTAVQYSAPQPACFATASFLSDTNQFPVTVGGSQAGVAIGYGACLNGPIATLLMNYFATGLTGLCCEYPVLPDPNVPSGTIEVVDCAGAVQQGATGLVNTINGDATCNCDAPLPTEDTTWGGVKELFRSEN
jgi:hypothetical protein